MGVAEDPGDRFAWRAAPEGAPLEGAHRLVVVHRHGRAVLVRRGEPGAAAQPVRACHETEAGELELNPLATHRVRPVGGIATRASVGSEGSLARAAASQPLATHAPGARIISKT